MATASDAMTPPESRLALRASSPARAIWESRRELQAKIDVMAFMGLHVYDPAWNSLSQRTPNQPSSIKANTMYSASFRECTLTIFGTRQSMTIPVQTCTRVGDVKSAIAARAMVSQERVSFVIKQGCTWAVQLDSAEVGRRVIVKGIKSFDPEPYKYPHPTGIIGAGYNGLKHALYWLHHGDSNFVIFERWDKVGGTAWLKQANKTSKLQTELAAFHVWFGMEWGADNKKLTYPTEWSTWPGKEETIKHMQHAAERYGILPYIRFKTNVSKVDIVGRMQDLDRSYNFTVQDLDKNNAESSFMVSNLLHFPGAYYNPRIINYPGEEEFGGRVGYGMADDIPFDNLKGKCTAILGNGAFAVENIRTCMEYGASKVYIVTRRKNLALPRLCCWFCHQAVFPVPAAMLLNSMEPMYKACGFGDPWSYHSVYGSREKMNATIRSNSRFGIGDVTFLAVATGRCEYVQDLLKRCSSQTLHLEGGRKLEGVHNIIKALGLIADFEADRMHRIKEMIGMWPDGDNRRFLFADPLGMNAANFMSHSAGPGCYSQSVSVKFFLDYPGETTRLKAQGIEAQLPRMKATDEKPTYQVDAKYVMLVGFCVDAACPLLQAKMVGMDDYMSELYWAVNPFESFWKECVDSWDKYQEDWRNQGHEFQYVDYPYTRDMVEGWFQEYEAKVGPRRVADKAVWRPATGGHEEEDVDVGPVQYDRGNSQQWWRASGVLS
mmetsp:Transcript_57903/g.167837  ORF Transcript_57903/g.167837 Transcript_57903/m.167837 type:complete len:719 (+) Transcript_57903:97-2253(+)